MQTCYRLHIKSKGWLSQEIIVSMNMHKKSMYWWLLILANVLWATSYVSAKFVLQSLSVTMMLALRLGISALILLPLVIIKRKELHVTRQDLWQLALLAVVGFVINKLFEFNGLALSTATDVALLISSESLFTAILSWVLLREPFRRNTLLFLLIGLFGVYLVVGQGLLPTGGDVRQMVGNLLVVLSLFSEAFYTVRGKSLLVRHSPFLITAAAIVGSICFWGPVAGWEVLHTGWPHLDLTSWLAIVWLALMATVIAYLAWFYGLTKIEGSHAASTLFLQPLLGTVLAILLLHETLTLYTLAGGILIIFSVYVIAKKTQPPETST